MNFDDNFSVQQGRITVLDGTTNAPVDPYDLSNYTTTSGLSEWRDQLDMQRTAYANLSRDMGWRLPLLLKGGIDVRESNRDARGAGPTYSFVGPDGRANTADDGAARFLNPDSLVRPGPFGFPAIQWPDVHKFWQYYQANPSQFVVDDPTAAYRTQVNFSKHAEQVVSAAFLRGDILGFERRLKIVTGVRAEQTNVEAEGPLSDPTRNFQRNASGNFILGANGRPLPITTDTLRTAQLTLVDRGTHASKEYLRLFPSLNASWNLRENLVARAAWYTSVGRPDFNKSSAVSRFPIRRILQLRTIAFREQRRHQGVECEVVLVRLEYYFERVGQFSVGAFRRNIKNFFGSDGVSGDARLSSSLRSRCRPCWRFDVSTQYNLPGRPCGWTGLRCRTTSRR